MSAANGVAGAARPDPTRAAPRDPKVELERLSNELESVFFFQLFQAMRESVPRGGLIESTSGEQMMQSLLDERLASAAAERTTGGLSDAIYRQLSRRLAPTPSGEAP